MLRHYDKIGILIPQHVDEYSGYRYYDIEQLVQANRIVSLKSMGFGPDGIKSALSLSSEEPEKLLKNKHESKMAEMKSLENQFKYAIGVLAAGCASALLTYFICSRQLILKITRKNISQSYASQSVKK